nr:uncharacterized protein LOC102148661 isoform X2 [Equus caballus]
MSCGARVAGSSEDHNASSEEKDCPTPNLDTSKDSKSGEDSSSQSSSESESDNEEPKPEKTSAACALCSVPLREKVESRLAGRGGGRGRGGFLPGLCPHVAAEAAVAAGSVGQCHVWFRVLLFWLLVNSLNGELGESSAEEASAQVSFTGEEWEDKESRTDHFNSEFNKVQPYCEHCNAESKHHEQVTPRLLSRGQFLLKVDTEGIYQCTETGLIFEVNRKVDIKYCVLSWSKYADLVVKPWAVSGPLFDVKCDPACLTSIQFPHSLCLGHHDANMTFKVLHVKSSGALLESTVDHSATHVKWHVSSLSPVGPVMQSEETVYHHGAVILYKAIDHNPSLSFRVYIATNNESFIKDISKSIKHSSKKFMKIDKPPVCQKLLQNGKKYRLISEPEAEITPEEIEFVDGSLLKLKSYIEVYLEQPVEFKLLLVEMDSEEIVWKAKLRECDWIQHDQNRNISKSSMSDGVKARSLLTDAQLITLAGKLGKEWTEVAMASLALDTRDIDDIQEKKDVTIYNFKVLKKWQEKEQGNATAQNLYNCLKNVPVEVQDMLKGFLRGT